MKDPSFVFDMDLEKCAGFCGFGKVRWILWIWKSALDFVFGKVSLKVPRDRQLYNYSPHSQFLNNIRIQPL